MFPIRKFDRHAVNVGGWEILRRLRFEAILSPQLKGWGNC
jgi:hypothetical protein